MAAQPNLDLSRLERGGGGFGSWCPFHLVANLQILARAWRDEVRPALLTRTLDVNVVVTWLDRGQDEFSFRLRFSHGG
jgi:hypothetical protein